MAQKRFTFNKNSKGEWYLILPEWGGAAEDLQMIQGADLWLDLLSGGGDTVSVQLAASPFEEASILTLIRLGEPNLGGGGNYFLETYQGTMLNLKLWLCDITTFIFGDYPQRIYFAVDS